MPWLRAALLPCALVLASSRADAYCRTTTEAGTTQSCTTEGAPLFWRNACRGVRLGPLPAAFADRFDDYKNTLEVALAQWDKAPCPDGSGDASISIAYLGETEQDFIGFHDDGSANENAIYFRETWKYADANQVALTTVTYRSDTGDILDADMEVNSELNISSANPLPARGFDLLTVYAHELGHVLGLAHSEVQSATMYAVYQPGSTDQGSLEDDDRAGLCAIYPPGNVRSTLEGEVEANECDTEALPDFGGDDGGCGCHSAPRPAAALAPIASALLALGVLRRRARAHR